METENTLGRAYQEARALEDVMHAFAEAIRSRMSASPSAPAHTDLFVDMMGALKSVIADGQKSGSPSIDLLATAFERKITELIPDIADAVTDCDIILTSSCTSGCHL